MKNLLLVANFKPDVGYAWWLMERFWVLLANEAAAAGRRTFLAYPTTGQVPENIAQSPIDVLTLPVPTSGKGVDAVSRAIAKHSIGGMYFTDQPYLSFTYGTFRRAGVHVIATHDHTPGDRPPVTGIRGMAKSLVHRWSHITADRYIALSPLMRERAVRTGRIPTSRIIVIPNGIDPLDVRNSERTTVRSELGLTDDDFVVVSVGRAHRYKGVHRILNAIARARAMTARNIVFVHIGDGPHLADFRQQATALGLPNASYRFLGKRSDAAALLSAFDVAVHASDGEAFSLAILEYMRAGLATLVSDQPSVAQAITHEKNGLVFRRHDVDDFAANMVRLVHDEPLRRKLAVAGQREVALQYSWARTVQEFTPFARWLVMNCR